MVLKSVISAALWLFSVVFFVLAGSLYLFAALIISPKTLHPIARWTCRGMLLTAGQSLRLRGEFPAAQDGPFIYMFNHTSLLDTLVVIAVIPEFTGAIGKQEQFKVPIWGWILRRWGAVPIDRNELGGAIESLNRVGETLKNGLSLLIAPEGTRSADGTLGPFKKGPFHLALQHDVAILPLAITGAYRAKRKGSWLLSPGVIEVEVLPLISGRSDVVRTVESLRASTRKRFTDCLEPPHRDT